MILRVDAWWPDRQPPEQRLAETASNILSESMNRDVNESLGGPLFSAGMQPRGSWPIQQPTWDGEQGSHRGPSGFSPASAGCKHRISAHRQDQPFPSPRLRMLPRKALAWSQQDSLELAVGTGVPVHPQGSPEAQGAACTDGNTSLLLENFSQAVTHSSMVSTRISSGMSEC